jgi:hypothetical protein
MENVLSVVTTFPFVSVVTLELVGSSERFSAAKKHKKRK